MRAWMISSIGFVIMLSIAIGASTCTNGTTAAIWLVVAVGCVLGIGLLDIFSNVENYLKQLIDATTSNQAPTPPTEE